jgi:hypothetical protein
MLLNSILLFLDLAIPLKRGRTSWIDTMLNWHDVTQYLAQLYSKATDYLYGKIYIDFSTSTLHILFRPPTVNQLVVHMNTGIELAIDLHHPVHIFCPAPPLF